MNEGAFRLPKRCYRLLMRGYPRGFRELYEVDMLLDFEDMYREALEESASWGVAGFWVHTLLDLLVSILNERLRQTSYRKRGLTMTDTTAFNNQLASTIAFWARLMRGGYSVKQVIALTAEHAPEPTASEMQGLLEDAEETGNLIVALESLQSRLQSPYYQQLLTILLEQFQNGGNLADKLDVLTESIRQAGAVDDWAADFDYNDGKDSE